MERSYSFLKVDGYTKEKIQYALSFILVYPIFKTRHYEHIIHDAIEHLTFLKFNLLKIVRWRQNAIAILYVKYHKILPTIVEELSRNIIEQEVNSYNFNDMEMEIEGIQQLVESNIDYNHDVASEYNKMLRWSEQEFANVVQSYHSYYAKLVIKTSRLPWKYLFKIFNLNELELTQQ